MLLGFKKQFTLPIQLGTKVLTLRKPRKITPKIGETLHMYSALRTKHVQLISKSETLKSMQKASVQVKRLKDAFLIRVKIDNKLLSHDQLEEFVVFDGFKNIEEWADYWLEGKQEVKEKLDLFHWTDLKY